MGGIFESLRHVDCVSSGMCTCVFWTVSFCFCFFQRKSLREATQIKLSGFDLLLFETMHRGPEQRVKVELKGTLLSLLTTHLKQRLLY